MPPRNEREEVRIGISVGVYGGAWSRQVAQGVAGRVLRMMCSVDAAWMYLTNAAPWWMFSVWRCSEMRVNAFCSSSWRSVNGVRCSV